MRRADREIKQRSEILRIINSCKVMRIAMCSDNLPYIVPVNFGYWDNTFFFHSAEDGKKIEIMRDNPNVCIELDGEHGLISGKDACEYSYNYSSVIAFGTVEKLEDVLQKKTALNAIMKHQTGREFPLPDEMLERVALFAVHLKELSCKSNNVNPKPAD